MENWLKNNLTSSVPTHNGPFQHSKLNSLNTKKIVIEEV